MDVLLFLFCHLVAIAGNSRNSRFGGFNSRLGHFEFPFSELREFAGKPLIRPAVFGAKSTLLGQNGKISRLDGNNQESPRLANCLDWGESPRRASEGEKHALDRIGGGVSGLSPAKSADVDRVSSSLIRCCGRGQRCRAGLAQQQ